MKVNKNINLKNKIMNTLEILKNRKEEIIEKTIEILPVALAGDRANRTFFVKIDDEGNLKVDYFYYAGQIVLNDNCFFTIKDHETPDPEDYGYDRSEEHTSELQSHSFISYAVFCLKKKNIQILFYTLR